MAVGITGGFILCAEVHPSIGGLVPFTEVSCSDELPVTGEVVMALTLPLGGNRAKAAIIEALSLRPYSGVYDADNEIRPEIGLLQKRPGSVGGLEAEELRGAGGMESADLFGDEREDVGVRGELLGFGVGELGREAMEDGVVGVEDGGGGSGGERLESGFIPVVMGGEDGGLGVVIYTDDECPPL